MSGENTVLDRPGQVSHVSPRRMRPSSDNQAWEVIGGRGLACSPDGDRNFWLEVRTGFVVHLRVDKLATAACYIDMHFSYLDETGCTGINLADAEQPVFVLGGISVTDEAWRSTTERFNGALDNFFGGARPAGAELHACDLINRQGIFAGRGQEECNALAHRYLDIIAERGHAIHFIGIDKARMAARVAGAPEAFFDLNVPYLLSFNYLVSYIERHTKKNLGQSARAMVIIDPKEEYHTQIDAITHYRRYEGVKARRLKRLVEFTYPVDSVRHPMVQVSGLVIFLVRKFLEMENEYRPGWPDEAQAFFAGCYAKIIDRVKWRTLIPMEGAEQAGAGAMLEAVQSTHRQGWKHRYGL